MVDTLQGVVQGMSRFSERFLAPTPPAPGDLVEAAHRIYSTLLEAEAQHVSLALEPSQRFPFGEAQDRLAGCRNDFADLLEDACARASLDDVQRRELGRLDLMARKAPLTSAADLEQIRGQRGGARRAV